MVLSLQYKMSGPFEHYGSHDFVPTGDEGIHPELPA